MVHPRLASLLRSLLGTMLLVSGSIPPVRYGHIHAHHGEHEHHAQIADHIPVLPDLDHDVPAPESGEFHWHSWLPGHLGTLATNQSDTPIRGVVTTVWIGCDMAVINTPSGELDDLGSFGPSIGLLWRPPPGFPSEFRIPSGSELLTPPHLQFVSSVLVRC